MEAIVITRASQQPYIGICRHFGGISINGIQFRHIPSRDILIRHDWVKCYNSMSFEAFIKAVETGVKPKFPRQRGEKKNKDELPSLF